MNQFTHFYLYAKGWYVTKNYLEDLRTITADFIGTDDVSHVSDDDVFQVIMPVVFHEINKHRSPESFFTRFVKDCVKENAIDCAIGFLRFSDVENEDIGLPDENILPLSEGAKKKLMREGK